MSDEILARHQARRDRCRPQQRVQDLISSPLSRVLGSAYEALLVDFELRERLVFSLNRHILLLKCSEYEGE